MPAAQNYVLTFIANPALEPITNALITDLQKRLKRLVDDMKIEWLGEREACEVFCKTDELSPLKIELRSLLQGKPYDHAILKAGRRKKKLLISDMDSTMIRQECIDELADFAGLKHEVAAITEAAMRGELEFKEALIRRVALLKGMDAALLEQVYLERIELMPGARTLIATMKAKGARTLLVSGGFTFFTQRVAEEIGFDGDMANTLGIAYGQLTGQVVPPILDKESKLLTLQKVAEAYGLELEQTMAVGDGANDLPMIEAAGIGVAYRGKDVVKRGADAAIDHADLTALLYLQGYKKAEFVNA
jgi:phosphoserine phosphatase